MGSSVVETTGKKKLSGTVYLPLVSAWDMPVLSSAAC